MITDWTIVDRKYLERNGPISFIEWFQLNVFSLGDNLEQATLHFYVEKLKELSTEGIVSNLPSIHVIR